jgi:23S rRNA (adenine2503-C2)-methyltransferase
MARSEARMNPIVDLRSLNREEIGAFVAEAGERPYRARQLFRWLHQKGARTFNEMSDLPAAFRKRLSEIAALTTLEKDLEQQSADGTIKYRFRTADGKRIESVFMPEVKRRTLCVSTQVGCAMGCEFCMTATMGLVRHLTSGEIVDQVHRVNRDLKERGIGGERPVTNLVFMGMGEPLHNFDNVVRALDILLAEDGPNFSQRHVTVSTVGLVPDIERFGERTPVKLAISLNATTDETRSRLMPVNKKWNLAKLLEAARKFPMRQGRRITFEYVLMRGVNDTDADAERLATLLRGIPAKVNVIPYNDNPGLPFSSPGEARADAFREILFKKGITAVVRKNRGRDIAAACGQLANMSAVPPPEASTP